MQVLDDYARALIYRRVQSLVGKYGLTMSDQPDLEQEFSLAVLEQWPQFDPAKSSHHTFVYRVIRNKAATVVRARRRGKRGHGLRRWPLEKAANCATHERGNGSGLLEGEHLQLALDSAEVVSQLTPDQQDLCVRLSSSDTPGQVARDLKIDRSAVYRRLWHVRSAFESAGMQEYLYPT